MGPEYLKGCFLAKLTDIKDFGDWAVKHPREAAGRTEPTNSEL